MSKERAAFLWLLLDATAEEAEDITEQIRLDPNVTWTGYIEKNLVNHLKKPTH